jgi:hypothetical protein
MFLPQIKLRRSGPGYTLLLTSIGGALAGFIAAFLAIKFYQFQLMLQAVNDSSLASADVFYVAAPLAALVLTPLLWWYFIIRKDQLTLRRGVCIGFVGSVLAHPLAWLFAMILATCTGSRAILSVGITNPFLNPLAALLSSLFLSVFSLLMVGWITMVMGGLAGGIIAALQRRFRLNELWRTA